MNNRDYSEFFKEQKKIVWRLGYSMKNGPYNSGEIPMKTDHFCFSFLLEIDMQYFRILM